MTLDTTRDYVKSWERRIIENAPKNETADDVISLMTKERYLNRGRWAALVVRLGKANRRGQ